MATASDSNCSTIPPVVNARRRPAPIGLEVEVQRLVTKRDYLIVTAYNGNMQPALGTLPLTYHDALPPARMVAPR